MIQWRVWRAVFVKTYDGVGALNSGRKGAQGGAWIVGGGEWNTRTQGEKKEKQSHLFAPAQKCDLLVVLYMRC